MLTPYSHRSPGSKTSGMRKAASLLELVGGMPVALTYRTVFASHCS